MQQTNEVDQLKQQLQFVKARAFDLQAQADENFDNLRVQAEGFARTLIQVGDTLGLSQDESIKEGAVLEALVASKS